MAVVVLGGISSFIVIMTACIPLQALWDFTLGQTAKCVNQLLYVHRPTNAHAQHLLTYADFGKYNVSSRL